MSSISWPHQPNKITQKVTNASTDWTEVTIPTGVPPKGGRANVTVGIRCVNAGSTAAGSLIFVDFDAASAPTIGWPIIGGEADVFTINNKLWLKLTSSSDLVYLVWAF